MSLGDEEDASVMADWRAVRGKRGYWLIETVPGADGNITFGPMAEDLILQVVHERFALYDQAIRSNFEKTAGLLPS